MRSLADALRRDPEDGRSFLDGELLDLPQHERRAIQGVETLKRLPDPLLRVPPPERRLAGLRPVASGRRQTPMGIEPGQEGSERPGDAARGGMKPDQRMA